MNTQDRTVVQQAIAAFKTCRTSGYTDVDGDFCKTYRYDEGAVSAALTALQKIVDAPKVEELMHRVVRKSNFDNPMIADTWASKPMSKDEAELVAAELNKGASDYAYFWHSVVPETYSLYVFEP